jgi:primosomal protein N' (replication factor Y) (superfamily II helicase)
MIAHVVFDLPLEGFFDYLIPADLIPKVTIGSKVKVLFRTKPAVGFVIALATQAQVAKIIPIKKLADEHPVFDARDLEFAKHFSAFYGCSLGEALATITRHRSKVVTSNAAPSKKPSATLYHADAYAPIIEELTSNRQDYAIIVPDAAVANGLGIPASQRPFVGLRVSMFEAFAKRALVVVIDEDNMSYKQEQSPMYETRDVVMLAQQIYGFDLAFISLSPSVELMYKVEAKEVLYKPSFAKSLAKPMVIDLSNYKFLDKGILSPPARNMLEASIKNKRQTLIVSNRRGSYSVTRCKNCSHILKCPRCDSAIIYSRSQKQYCCRHCTFTLKDTPPCPDCAKQDWMSFGFGIEQIQKELSVLLPTARIAFFDKETQSLPTAFDILIATQSILRFKHKLRVHTVLFANFDDELNRMDMRSSFKSWALAQHFRKMGEQLFLQSRNRDHHVLKALSADSFELFYQEELKLRKELDFSPFAHWLEIMVRSRIEKSAQSFALDVYNDVLHRRAKHISVSEPEPAVPAKLRDQHRFKIMMSGQKVEELIPLIKESLSNIKRRSGVIVTLNINP